MPARLLQWARITRPASRTVLSDAVQLDLERQPREERALWS